MLKKAKTKQNKNSLMRQSIRFRYDTGVGVVREFNIMLRSLMVKVSNMQKLMGNVSRDKETLRNSQKEMLEGRRNYQRMPLMVSSVNWTQLRKEPESLKIGQQKLPY